jgi:hypothetical protein
MNKENESRRVNAYKNSKLSNYSKLNIKKQWNLSCFKIGKKLGRGRFGSVFVAE